MDEQSDFQKVPLWYFLKILFAGQSCHSRGIGSTGYADSMAEKTKYLWVNRNNL